MEYWNLSNQWQFLNLQDAGDMLVTRHPMSSWDTEDETYKGCWKQVLGLIARKLLRANDKST